MRRYGEPPFDVVVIHGGPGAPGYMAPVARELSVEHGIIEPFQSADSVNGQVEELYTQLKQHADLPVTLIGSSWGAMLGYIFTARHLECVKKLILVGSGAYETHYATNINQIRLSRLLAAEKDKAEQLLISLNKSGAVNKDLLLRQLATLFIKSDCYAPLTNDIELVACQYEIYSRVWREMEALRSNGELLAMADLIQCPTIAIHGDYDPHSAEGVQTPLSAKIKQFKFVLLPLCGHYPWMEKYARDDFFTIVRQEI